MSATDDLRAAGFSDAEVNSFASEKRQSLLGAGFSDDEVNDYLGTTPKQPDMAAANKTFASTMWARMKDAVKSPVDAAAAGGAAVDPIRTAQLEAGLNAGSGLLFGFPAQVAAGLSGLVAKHALGMDVDPAEMAEHLSKAVTYVPRSPLGIQLTGQVNAPLVALGEGASWSGHKITDLAMKAGLPDSVAAGAGAITEQTIALLPGIMLGELGRKMGGQRIDASDMQNAAKVVAGPEAPPASVKAAETSLRATYEKTGIGPFTVLKEAQKDPALAAELVDPKVEVPSQLAQYVEKPPEMSEVRPGDGEPLLDVSDEMPHPSERADDLMTLSEDAYWSERGGEPTAYGPDGEVTERKPWIPAAEWYADMRRGLGSAGLSDKEAIQTALQKAINDQPMTPKEQRTVDFLRNEVENSKREVPPVEYQGEHRPVTVEGGAARLHDLVPAFGNDIYGKDAAQFFGTGDNKLDGQTLRVLKAVRGKPDAEVTVYRAVPKDATAETLNSGDWVTVNRAYAEQHGERTLEGNYKVVEQKVKASDLTTNADSFHEQGYYPEQPSSAGFDRRSGAGTLNAGLNPAAVLASVRDSYTPFVGVEADHVKPPAVDSAGKPKSALGDSLRKIFAPATRGESAALQAGIMRANLGEMARAREVALEQMKATAAGFDKMPVAENIKFIDAMEKGTGLTDPKLAEAAADLRALLDAKRDEVRALGKGQLDNYDENYFPHIWKDPEAAQAMFARRPLQGSGAFLKARTIPYTTDGMRWRAYDAEGDFVKSFDTEAEAKLAAGTDGRVGQPLTPITTNPVELALLKAREMDKYVYGQNIFNEMKANDLARFVPFGGQSLPGWTKINDKIARVLQPNEGEGGGMILRGEYYAPDEAATLINNHLSPGLQGNTFFDAWRGIGSAMNGLQLGLSFFHVGFTSMDAMVSKVALGVKQLSRGDVVEGATNMAQGVNPAQPFINLYKGDRLLQAYLGKLDNPDLLPIVDAIQQAGGRVKMDDFYRNEAVNTFKQALRRATLAADVGDTAALFKESYNATKAFLPTVLDRMSAPIFEYLVPRQKLGVFFDMSKDWLEKNPDATVAEKRAGLGKLWDSVDNRMGQLVYDNVFWNHALKDGLMATVRSVGWNLGTFRELGGGVLDLKNIAKDKGFSDRTAYVVALPLVAAVYGAVTNYAYTGEAPRDLKDAFYPRTGRLRPDGSEDRVSLPTYMKDVFAYGEDAKNFALYGADPLQTLKNKAHPLIATVSQMLNNADFFGGAIRNPADPITRQLMDEAAYLRQQIEPFSIRNYFQQAKLKGEEPSIQGYLTSPSMVGITPAPGYMTKSDDQLESAQVNRMREPLIQKYREAIKNGMSPDEAIPEMIKGGLSKRDIKYVISSSGETPKPSRLKKFGTQ